VSAADDLAEQLERVLGHPVTELVRLSGGASRETWAFAMGDEKCILQRDRQGALRTGGGMRGEAALLRAAAECGVPVARLIVDGSDGEHLGLPFIVTERVEGETIPRKLLRDEVWAEVRPRLAAQCGTALAAIHQIPLSAAPDLVAQDQVEQFRGLLDTLGEPHPAFELGFRWLEANRPPANEPAVVHGDFRNGNLLVGPDGIRAVLDWELAHLGDPMEDLGWLCVKAWRFGSPKPVGGFGERAELFAAYEAAGGGAVDPEVVRWWELLGTVKWGIMCIIQARTHLDGLSRSVELAAIGRRTCENEFDLLELIA
jgi:aminoglycoside phosphotransferase (APT) family kinase protein